MSVAVGESLRLPRGTLIKCPNPKCNETIGRLSRPLKLGDRRIYFVDGSGQGARVDRLPHCKCCNFRWVVSEHDLQRIHTGRGWFPNDKHMGELQRGS